MHGYDYLRPRTLAEAFDLAAGRAGARFIAGGTDLMVRFRRREVRPPALVSLRAIPELRRIEVGAVTRIGATATVSEIIAHPALAERYPVLVAAARALGSEQIRNVATIGGNLCNASPCADTAPPLMVLDARVELRGPAGGRVLPLADFFRGPGQTALADGEVLAAVLLDPPRPAARATFLKQGRVRMDLALASVAVLLEMEGERCGRARVAAGSVAPTPLRLAAVEALLEGQPLTRSLLAAAEEAARRGVAPITDVRATAEYRRTIVGVFVRRAVEHLLGWSHA